MPPMKNSGEEKRKSKPLVERRRRARINESLEQLKQLVPEARKKECAQSARLEKAEILELAVKHLRFLQQQQSEEITRLAQCQTRTESLSHFMYGYTASANEVLRFVNHQGVDPALQKGLATHLASKIFSPGEVIDIPPGLFVHTPAGPVPALQASPPPGIIFPYIINGPLSPPHEANAVGVCLHESDVTTSEEDATTQRSPSDKEKSVHLWRPW